MYSIRMLVLSAAVLTMAAGCNGDGDNDEDGLTNAEEKAFGTDKDVADSDGDGYTDYEEFIAGTFGNSPGSLPYAGHWPFNANKDSMGSPLDDFSGNPVRTQPVARVTGLDQFGQEVDIYDFIGHGKPVLIDVSAAWCPPCRQMAQWLEGDAPASYLDEYNNVRDAVDNDEVYWITFIAEDLQGGNADQPTVRAWYDDYPNDKVPVLVDTEKRFTDWMGLEAFPTTMLINADGTIEAYRSSDNTLGLQRLSETLGN